MLHRGLYILVCGLTVGFSTALSAISYASLIFSGDLSIYFPNGVAILLISSTIMSLIIACFSTTVEVITEPQDTVSALIALMTSSIAAGLASQNLFNQIYPTVIVLIGVSALILGLFFWMFGAFRWSKLFRYIPFPVIAGILAGLGWILINSSVSIITDYKLSLENLQNQNFIIHLLPGVAFTVILLYISQKQFHYLVFPVTTFLPLILSVLLWCLDFHISEDWFFKSVSPGAIWPPLHLSDFGLIHWPSIFNESRNLVVLILTSTIAFLFNLTALELLLKKDINFDRELKTMGLANLAVGTTGGVAGYHAIMLTTLSHKLGAKSRLVGIICALCTFVTFLIGSSLLQFIPKFMMGGMVLYFGIKFIYDWAIAIKNTVSLIDYSLILSILLISVMFGFLNGVLIGVAIAIVFFVIQYSRIDILKSSFSWTSYPSHVERSLSKENYLKEHGEEIYILKLHSFLFFGTAYNLYEKITSYIENHVTHYIVIDFKDVSGMDSSTILVFLKLGYFAKARNIQLVFTSLALDSKKYLNNADKKITPTFMFFDHLNMGVEWCENELLKNFIPVSEEAQVTLPDILPHLKKQKFSQGEYLIHQGSSSAEMFIVQSGEATVILNLKSGEKIRIRTLLAGSLIGELSFFLNIPSTADVVAECETIVYQITKPDLDKRSKDYPEKFQEFQNYIIKLFAERILKSHYAVIE